jgi:uncharacterized membrane protein
MIHPDPPVRPRAARLAHIDALRGLALVLLVLEAARQYFHGAIYDYDALDLRFTTPALFATRWITHIAAPILALLIGVSAHLRLAQGDARARVSRFLAARGLLIIMLELTLVAFGRNFAVYPILFAAFGTAGCAMIALAVLIWAPRYATLALGIVVLAAGGMLERLQSWHFGPLGWLWQLLDEPLVMTRDGRLAVVADYSFIPWIAIAMVGYGLGPLFAAEAKRRDPILLALGVALLALFAVLRAANAYGDPIGWSMQGDALRTFMAFMKVEKFPPSVLYACVTMGLAFVLTPLIARLTGPTASFLRTFGAAPMLAYVLHFYVMHVLAIAAALARGLDPTPLAHQISFLAETDVNPGLGFDLPGVYLAWLAALALLYPPVRWWAKIKTSRANRLLAYL